MKIFIVIRAICYKLIPLRLKFYLIFFFRQQKSQVVLRIFLPTPLLSKHSYCRNNDVTALEALYCSSLSVRASVRNSSVRCAPLIFSCCLRASTKLLFIIAGHFHAMLCVIISLIKPIKLSKILVYNTYQINSILEISSNLIT